MRRLLSLAAVAALAAGMAPASAADPTAGINVAQCTVAFTGNGDDDLRVCNYIPISSAATLAISGTSANKWAQVDCLTGSSPRISSGIIRIKQTPGDYCTLHLYIGDFGSARASADSRL